MKFLRKEPLVSIVILNHNRLSDLKACLASIRRHTPERHEIILIDNGSTDGSLPYLRSIPEVQLVENETNPGCAQARAQGLAFSSGDFIAFLDNDTIVTPRWLGILLEHFERDRSLGLLGPRSNHVSGPQRISPVSYRSVEELDRFAAEFTGSHRGKVLPAVRLVGFCMVLRREVIDRIGAPDPRFSPFGFEDDDYTFRGIIAGFKAAIAHDVFIHHTGGPQSRGDFEYNRHLRRSWEILKDKWDLPVNLPYGEPYDVGALLRQPFDRALHYVPMPAGGEPPFSAAAPVVPAISAAECFRKSRDLLHAGRPEEAIGELEKLVEREPDQAYAHSLLGALYSARGGNERALFHFEKAAELQPGNEIFAEDLARIRSTGAVPRGCA